MSSSGLQARVANEPGWRRIVDLIRPAVEGRDGRVCDEGCRDTDGAKRCPGHGAVLPALKDDFNKINTILARLVGEVQEELAQIWRTLRLLNRLDEARMCLQAALDLDPDGAYQVLHSSMVPGSNIVSYRNPEVDRLLEKGRMELKSSDRDRIYREIGLLLAADQPYTLLFFFAAPLAIDSEGDPRKPPVCGPQRNIEFGKSIPTSAFSSACLFNSM